MDRDSIVTTHWRADCQGQKWKQFCDFLTLSFNLCHKIWLSESQFNFQSKNTMSFYLWESKTQSSPDYRKELIIQKLDGFYLFGDLTDTHMPPAIFKQKGCILGTVGQALQDILRKALCLDSYT